MKKLFMFIIVLLLAASPVLAISDGDTYYVAVSELNIRESASKSADVITTVGRGTALTATGNTEGQWMEVYTDSYTIRYSEARGEERIGPLRGWVFSAYLTDHNDYQPWDGVIAANGRVHLRETAGGAHLLWLQPGDAVTVLYPQEEDGVDWYRVRLTDGVKGCVAAEFVGVGSE